MEFEKLPVEMQEEFSRIKQENQKQMGLLGLPPIELIHGRPNYTISKKTVSNIIDFDQLERFYVAQGENRKENAVQQLKVYAEIERIWLNAESVEPKVYYDYTTDKITLNFNEEITEQSADYEKEWEQKILSLLPEEQKENFEADVVNIQLLQTFSPKSVEKTGIQLMEKIDALYEPFIREIEQDLVRRLDIVYRNLESKILSANRKAEQLQIK